jgi:uncharacterized protein (DUF1330 family)
MTCKPAYLVAIVEVRDEARYQAEYAPAMQATLDPFGGRYLAQRSPLAVAEGTFGPGRVVLIAFPDMARAQAWYASDAYRPLLDLRQAVAVTRLGFFEGLPA